MIALHSGWHEQTAFHASEALLAQHGLLTEALKGAVSGGAIKSLYNQSTIIDVAGVQYLLNGVGCNRPVESRRSQVRYVREEGYLTLLSASSR